MTELTKEGAHDLSHEVVYPKTVTAYLARRAEYTVKMPFRLPHRAKRLQSQKGEYTLNMQPTSC